MRRLVLALLLSIPTLVFAQTRPSPLDQAYEEARAAIGYLRRREEDAESIAPTLYPGKGKRRASEPEPAAPPATQPGTGSAHVSADNTQPIPAVTPPAGRDGQRRRAEGCAREQGAVSELRRVREGK